MRTDIRFSMRQLFLWSSVYALLLGIVAGLPVPPIQIVAAIAVVTAFVIIDSISARDRSAVPAAARCSMVVAHFATAFAVGVGVCFALFLIVPEPPAPPKPPLSFLGTVYHIASGQLFLDVGQAVGKAVAIRITYYQLFAIFSAIAFSSSLFALRRFRSAKWYALLNSPGTCLFILFVVAEILDSIGS